MKKFLRRLFCKHKNKIVEVDHTNLPDVELYATCGKCFKRFKWGGNKNAPY